MYNSSNNLFETLEDRSLFSANLAADGTLFVEGTSAGDAILIDTTKINGQDFVIVTESGKQTGKFHRPDVLTIEVNSLEGNDVITNRTKAPAVVYAGAGNDLITGGFGDDQLFGDLSNDSERGVFEASRPGNDSIFGNDGNDLIDGNRGNDRLEGDNGNDTLTGGLGIDRMFGGLGDDLLKARDASLLDIVDGGVGSDTAEVDRQRFSTIGVGGRTLHIRQEAASFCEVVIGR